MVNLHAGDIGGVSGLNTRDQVSHLGKAVHYYQDGVEPFTSTESGHEVNGDFFPGAVGDGEGLLVADGGVVDELDLIASAAITMVLFNVLYNLWPVE